MNVPNARGMLLQRGRIRPLKNFWKNLLTQGIKMFEFLKKKTKPLQALTRIQEATTDELVQELSARHYAQNSFIIIIERFNNDGHNAHMVGNPTEAIKALDATAEEIISIFRGQYDDEVS